MPIDKKEEELLTDRILSASDAARSIAPITADLPDFDLSDAYRVSALITEHRIARGERPVGWKIGFTNETIWDEYGVHAPIWGPMYDSTVAAVESGTAPATCAIGAFVEPRIEPEVAFRIASVPNLEMREAELIACVDAVAHGFEIVQSVFPAWRFRAADTVAAFALHGCYRHGPLISIRPSERARWLADLAGFQITLSRDGAEVDRGIAANVLGGGPLTALRHLVRGMAEFAPSYSLRIGDIVTTGTVTRAFPVTPGQRWSTKLTGIELPAMDLALV